MWCGKSLSFLIMLMIICEFAIFLYIVYNNSGCSIFLTKVEVMKCVLRVFNILLLCHKSFVVLKRNFTSIFLLLLLMSILFLRRSLLVQHQGRVKEALDNLSSFQTSISAGRRALQVRFSCILFAIR